MPTPANQPDALLFGLFFIAAFCFYSFPMVIFSWLSQVNRRLIILALTCPCHSRNIASVHFSRSVVSDSATPWTVAYQASLSISNSQSLFKFMSFELVIPFNPLILCHPLLLLPLILPSIRVFSNESTLRMR